MWARWVVALVCLAGCDQLFGLEHVDDIDASGGPGCPASYDIRIAGSLSSYRFEAAETAWDTAELRCETDADHITHLVVLDDDDERRGLVTVLGERQVTTTYWIGLSDRKTEAQFLWVSAQPVGMPPLSNPPWPVGQPDNDNGGQDCVRISGATEVDAGLFDDAECPGMFDYVCECDGHPAALANF